MTEKYVEAYLEMKLVEEIKKVGGLCLKLNSASMNGLPDRLILLPTGKAIFAEMKSTGKKPTVYQRYVHRKLMALEFPVYVIDGLKGVEELASRAAQVSGKGGDAV